MQLSITRFAYRPAILLLGIILAYSNVMGPYIPPDRLGGEHQYSDILGQNGRQMQTVVCHGETIEIDLGQAASGIYLLHASEQSGPTLGAKLVRP